MAGYRSGMRMVLILMVVVLVLWAITWDMRVLLGRATRPACGWSVTNAQIECYTSSAPRYSVRAFSAV